MQSDRALLEIVDVRKRYDSSEAEESPWILDGVSLTVAAGESVGIVGPSGSGKSTLLNLAGALDGPTEGRVTLDGRDLAALGEPALAEVRGRDVGFVFQLHHLLPQCTVLENVLIPTLARGRGGAGTGERAAHLLERVGLSGKRDVLPGRLSGGERQRVAVVRALINRPKLLLADEPTGSLDRASAGALADLLAELNRDEGVALVLVTHDPALAGRARRVLELRDGRLHAEDSDTSDDY